MSSSKQRVARPARLKSTPWIAAAIGGFVAGALVVGGGLVVFLQHKPTESGQNANFVADTVSDRQPNGATASASDSREGGAGVQTSELSHYAYDSYSNPLPSEGTGPVKAADITVPPSLTISSPPAVDPKVLNAYDSHITESR